MAFVRVTRKKFLDDFQGRTFSDVLNHAETPFDDVLGFFDNSDRQRRMEESELHHDRAPLAGVIRELEALPNVNQFLREVHAKRTMRFRQAIGVLVRMIMEAKGWEKTGRKGSLGVRAAKESRSPAHNTGGLAFWFLRAERYQKSEGMPFESVKDKCQKLQNAAEERTRSKSSSQ